uniref:Uncharacterized protein MANES_10G072200 n=1 Tax=Rhizophora mucronata TaxID=61149 RepID=A0A2P2MG51_RHIMU
MFVVPETVTSFLHSTKASSKLFLHDSFELLLMIIWVILLVRSFEEYPIDMAVSCLSPVKTHTLIPAILRDSMASGTPSCSLSSMAEAPSILRLFSILLATLRSNAALPIKAVLAASKATCHCSKSESLNSRIPMTSVLNPSDE